MLHKTILFLALAILSTPAAAVPAQYPLFLYTSTTCKNFIEEVEVLNTVCFDMPTFVTSSSSSEINSVRTTLGSIPDGWSWYAYDAPGCTDGSFVGFIELGGCRDQTTDGVRVGKVRSVKVGAPS